MSNVQDKYYFMGYWFPLKEVKKRLSAVTNIPENSLSSEEDVSQVIECMIKSKPAYFSRFSKEMHALRFGVSR